MSLVRGSRGNIEKLLICTVGEADWDIRHSQAAPAGWEYNNQQRQHCEALNYTNKTLISNTKYLYGRFCLHNVRVFLSLLVKYGETKITSMSSRTQ
jgi:hypothetical protein